MDWKRKSKTVQRLGGQEKPQGSTKECLEIVNKLSKAAGQQMGTQNSVVFLSASNNPKTRQELAQLSFFRGPPRPKRGHPGTEGAPGCPTGGAKCCCPGWWGLQVAWKPQQADTEPPAHASASSRVCKETWNLCWGGGAGGRAED